MLAIWRERLRRAPVASAAIAATATPYLARYLTHQASRSIHTVLSPPGEATDRTSNSPSITSTMPKLNERSAVSILQLQSQYKPLLRDQC